MNNFFRIFLLLAAEGCAAAGPAYPLKVAPGQHYLVDQNNTPFLVNGCSPWYLTESLSTSNVDYYLSNRWAQGYNAVLLDITATASEDGLNDDTNMYGQHPFTNTLSTTYTNLLSWNVNYFTNVDAVIERAGYYGMCVFAYPLYDTYPGFPGWYPNAMAGNPTTNLYQYGAFIGARYKNFTNIVWIGAGDYNEPNAPTNCLWNYIAAGILSQDTNHLITAQPQRTYPATYYSNFVTLNASYPACFPYIQSLANYQATPVMASFLREPYYEGASDNACGIPSWTAQECRNFAYWAVFSGDAGQFYGNGVEFEFAAGWQSIIVDETAVTIPYLSTLLKNFSWWNFVPDANHTVVTAGYDTSGATNYVTATVISGTTALAYLPCTNNITVNLATFSASTRARWYDPTSGSFSTISGSPFANTGTHNFMPSSLNASNEQDWVLVLDVSNAPGTVSLGLQALGGNIYELTVTGIPGQAFALQYNTNLNAAWQAVGNGTIDSGGAISYYVIAMSSAIFFRSLNQ